MTTLQFIQTGGQETVGPTFIEYPFVAGTDVSQALVSSDGLQAQEYAKSGTASVSVASTGTQTATVTFTNEYVTALDNVVLTLQGLGTAVINGGPYWTAGAKTGFTVNLDVTTAGTGSVTVSWVALGH